MRQNETYARVLIMALGVAVLFALLPFLSGFVGAAVLAVVVNPLQRRFARRFGARIAAAMTVATTVLLMLVPAAVLLVSVLAEAPGAARSVSESTILQRLSSFQIAGVDVGALADRSINALLTQVSSQAMVLFGSLTLATINAVIAVFGLYYLLIANGKPWREAQRLLPFSRGTTDALAERFRTTTESMLIGVVLTGIAQGLVVGSAFALVGLPSPAFWGFITACVSVLPILGSSLVWFPGTLVLLAAHRYGAALTLGLLGLIVASQIDNVIRPVVYRRVSQIHPMVTIVGAFAGMRLLGLAGLLLGPLGISYLLELAKAYAAEYGGRGASEIAAAPAGD